MNKIDLYKIIKSKQRNKIVALLVCFTVLAMGVGYFVIKNPGAGKAATVTQNADGSISITAGTVMVDPDGVLYNLNPSNPNETHTIDISNRSVRVTGVGTKLMFTGGNISLQNLIVDNGGLVSHIGPGNAEDVFTLQDESWRVGRDMSGEHTIEDIGQYVAAVYEGWFKSDTDLSNLQLIYDDAVRVYWGQSSTFTTPLPGPYNAGDVNIGAVTANQPYHFKIYYSQGTGARSIYFQNNGTGGLVDPTMFAVDDTFMETGRIFAQYYNAYGVSYTIDGLPSDTSLASMLVNPVCIGTVPPLVNGMYYGAVTHRLEVPLDYNRGLSLAVSGSVILQNGGSIDATGRGYASNFPGSGVRGYGTGAGMYETCDYGAGGGGYGGVGQQGGCGSAAGIAYGDQDGPVDLGSPGGQAGGSAQGGPGGGRIYIEAGTIQINATTSYILANGLDQFSWGRYDAEGSGSGGSVYLKAQAIITPSTGTIFSVAGGTNNSGQNGRAAAAAGSRVTNPIGMTYQNIFAKGGINNRNGGAGGGGRIKIELTEGSHVSIKKTLQSAYRRDASDDVANANGAHDNFNPYALQKGDIIKVVLTATNVNDAFSLRDDYFTGEGSTCDYITSDSDFSPITAFPTPVNTVGGQISWDSITDTDGDDMVQIYYFCKVQ